MFKRFITSIILMIIIYNIALSTYGFGKDITYSPNTLPTEQFLATITRPEVYNETTYKKIYLVCGSTENKRIRFDALVFDNNQGFFKALPIVAGGNSWIMDGPGIFTEQIILPKTGVNKVRIVAYDANANDFYPSRNLQVSDFFITLMEKNENDLFANSFMRISNMLSSLFR